MSPVDSIVGGRGSTQAAAQEEEINVRWFAEVSLFMTLGIGFTYGACVPAAKPGQAARGVLRRFLPESATTCEENKSPSALSSTPERGHSSSPRSSRP